MLFRCSWLDVEKEELRIARQPISMCYCVTHQWLVSRCALVSWLDRLQMFASKRNNCHGCWDIGGQECGVVLKIGWATKSGETCTGTVGGRSPGQRATPQAWLPTFGSSGPEKGRTQRDRYARGPGPGASLAPLKQSFGRYCEVE